MDFLNKLFSDIDEQDLHQLISLATPEIGSIEYKSKLPGATDNEKKEFLADVSSFANGSGGFIIYGMEEKKGVPIKLIGFSGLDIDNEVLRLENLIRSGIAPRIPSIQSRPVTLSGNTFALIIKIPKSWISPHMVTLGGSSRFYSRNSAGKYQLDVNEIRNAFTAAETVTNRIKDFRIDRINKIIVGDTPLPMLPGAKIILHLIPLNPAYKFNLKFAVDNYDRLSVLYPNVNYSPTSFRINLDGLVTNRFFHDDSISLYTQLFRNGTIEAVNSDLLKPRNENIYIIPSILFEKILIEATTSLLAFQKELGIEPPIVILLSLVGVKGYKMGLSQQAASFYYHEYENRLIDREIIQATDIVIEDYDSVNLSSTLRPIIDAVWNAAGWLGSIDYDEEGNWSALRQR